jgi:hypothetical protein
MPPQDNWFKIVIKNPMFWGAAGLIIFNTQFQPKPKTAAAITWYIATQTQSAIANAIPDTTKNESPKRK